MIKRVLIGLIAILLVLVAFVILKNGVTVLGHDVYSIPKIQQASQDLDAKILECTTLNKITFNSKMDELNSSLESLVSEKARYQTVLDQSSEKQIADASKINKYSMEFLWAKIGNYATAKKVILTLNVTAGLTPDTNDLNFTLSGSYTGITDFIYSLENDSKLAFKIEDFKLEPQTVTTTATDTTTTNTTTTSTTATVTVLTGTFTVRNLNINLGASNALQNAVNNAMNTLNNTNNTNNINNTTDANNVNNTIDANNTNNAMNTVNNVNNTI